MTPSNTTTATTTGATGAGAVVLIWGLGALGVAMPPEVAAAAVAVVIALAGWLVAPRNRGDHAAK